MSDNKLFLYKRPNHATVITDSEKDPKTGTLLIKKQMAVSAFVGIDIAVRGVSIGGTTMVEALRILRKIEKASHDVPNLQDRYLILKPSERKIVETSVTTFNWSKFCTENGINLWTSWLDFLNGFDPEADEYASTWLEYDPMNPPIEYATWKLQHDKDIAAYNDRIAKAEAAAAAKKQAASAAKTTVPVTTEATAEVEATAAVVGDTVTDAALAAIKLAQSSSTDTEAVPSTQDQAPAPAPAPAPANE